MWVLWFVGCKDEVTCPDGFEVVNKGCVPTTTHTTTDDGEGELVVTPSFLDLGVVDIPCTNDGTVEVRNNGDDALDVMTIEFTSNFGDLTLDPDSVPTVPLRLEPQGSFTLSFHLEGLEARADQGTLTITSTDQDAPTTFQSSGVLQLLNERTETVVAPKPIADVLLLVDTSPTVVYDNLDDVTLGIPQMLTTLDEAADWQLAVISGPTGCVNIPLVSDASTATANQVVSNIFTYPEHLYSEKLFELGDIALGNVNSCNAGMLRPGSQLHFIVISDEPEQSGQSWQYWVNHFNAFSGTFVVSAVADINGTCGFGATNYYEAALATGGVLLDICDPTWGEQMEGLVDAIAAGVVAPIPLSDIPLESSIRVEVDGAAVRSFRYNGSANTIEDIQPPPAPGAIIEITYGLAGECGTGT